MRVIDYQLDDGRENTVSYRLFTTVTDPDEGREGRGVCPTVIELAFDELKTHQRVTHRTWCSRRSGAMHYAVPLADVRGRRAPSAMTPT